MNVTRDVIADLLPLYQAGEASADTRALVEAFLAHDPELARRANESERRLRSMDASLAVPREVELQTIRRTRTMVKRRSILLSFAILFTLLPLSISFDEHGLRWVWSGAPAAAVVVGALAILSWAGYLALGRRLRTTGL